MYMVLDIAFAVNVGLIMSGTTNFCSNFFFLPLVIILVLSSESESNSGLTEQKTVSLKREHRRSYLLNVHHHLISLKYSYCFLPIFWSKTNFGFNPQILVNTFNISTNGLFTQNLLTQATTKITPLNHQLYPISSIDISEITNSYNMINQ